MWTHTYSHGTTSSADEVWSVLADIEGWRRWNDGIASITLDAPARVGATFRMTPPGEDTVLSTIVAFEPPGLLTDLTRLDGIDVRVEHRIDAETAVASEGTIISFTVTVTGDAPDPVLEQVGQAVSADFPDVIRGLADFAAAQRHSSDVPQQDRRDGGAR